MEVEEKHRALIDIAKKQMKSIKDSEHNLNHVEDVVKFTKELINNIDLEKNNDACIIAAYWHDVGRTKINLGHESLSSKMLEEQMLDMGYDLDFINICCNAIKNHKWNMKPETIEGLILKDADKLAFLGEKRWDACLDNHQRLDEIIRLLPKLRDDILYFEESKKIYDREIINVFKILYSKYYN